LDNKVFIITDAPCNHENRIYGWFDILIRQLSEYLDCVKLYQYVKKGIQQ